MTNIATKDGSIIVKDGSVGTECGCCGEWYCCPESPSTDCKASDLVDSITLGLSGFQYRLLTEQFGPGEWRYTTTVVEFPGVLVSTLPRIADNLWQTTFTDAAGCAGTIQATITRMGKPNPAVAISVPINGYIFYYCRGAFSSTPPGCPSRTASDVVSCGGRRISGNPSIPCVFTGNPNPSETFPYYEPSEVVSVQSSGAYIEFPLAVSKCSGTYSDISDYSPNVEMWSQRSPSIVNHPNQPRGSEIVALSEEGTRYSTIVISVVMKK